jgi:hypothetical protein
MWLFRAFYIAKATFDPKVYSSKVNSGDIRSDNYLHHVFGCMEGDSGAMCLASDLLAKEN